MNHIEFQFEKVVPSEEQIQTMFRLLSERVHKISCNETSYAEHVSFVNSHPYRSWFLIKIEDRYIGSFYISNENTIGINVADTYNRQIVKSILSYVNENFEPLAAIPSVRSGEFAINVSPTNASLTQALEDIGAKVAQITYYLPRA